MKTCKNIIPKSEHWYNKMCKKHHQIVQTQGRTDWCNDCEFADCENCMD